jgi:hypothetical protein
MTEPAKPLPEDAKRQSDDPKQKDRLREKMMDQTLADSYPASDPPSSIPDPSGDDSIPEEE